MNAVSLRKRYNYLWTGEATASMLFVLLFVAAAGRDGAWGNYVLRAYSLAVVVFILLQGVVWWRHKLRLLDTGRRVLPTNVLQTYARLRTLNWLLIGAYPVVALLGSWLRRTPLVTPDAVYGLLILGGALLEQINYYYYQLMYDSAYDLRYLWRHRRLRRGNVAKALDSQGS